MTKQARFSYTYLCSCINFASNHCVPIYTIFLFPTHVSILCNSSIGSLGDGNSEAHVSDVIVTSNGVRIKTYQGGSGNASNIKFENIEMENVRNPIHHQRSKLL